MTLLSVHLQLIGCEETQSTVVVHEQNRVSSWFSYGIYTGPDLDPCVYQCYAEPPLFCMAQMMWTARIYGARLKRVPQYLRIFSLTRLPTMYQISSNLFFWGDWITGSTPLEPNLGVVGHHINRGLLLMPFCISENWVKGFNKFGSQPLNNINSYLCTKIMQL